MSETNQDLFILTTASVRSGYVHHKRLVTKSRANYAKPEFDRWLNEVKAEAWTEGFDKGFYRGQILHGDYDASEAGIENPYEVG